MNDSDWKSVDDVINSLKGTAKMKVRKWTTGKVVDRSGRYAFVHLLKDEDDPERSVDTRKVKFLYRNIAKVTKLEWKRRLLKHLSDREPRTFNRICVELLDKTADIMFTTIVDDALWDLVRLKQIEHTTESPVLFRVRRQKRRKR